MAGLRVTAVDETTGREQTMHVREGDYVVIAVHPCEVEVLTDADGGRTRHLRIFNRVPLRGDGLWRPGGF